MESARGFVAVRMLFVRNRFQILFFSSCSVLSYDMNGFFFQKILF